MMSSIASEGPFYVYVDGIFDIPHDGHLAMMTKAYNKAKSDYPNAHLLVGVCDQGVKEYKRAPIMTLQERAESIQKMVQNKFPCTVLTEEVPISINRSFIEKHHIKMVVRGDDFSHDKLKEYYSEAMQYATFATVPYTQGVSTSDILISAKVNGTLGLLNTSHLTVSQSILVRRIQALSWRTLSIEPPAPSKQQGILRRFTKLDMQVLKENNQFAQTIHQSGQAHWASYYCLKSGVVHSTALTVDMCYRLFQTIQNNRNEFDNPQLIFARMAELSRDFAGAILATPIALFSPQRTAQLFHVKTDDFLARALNPTEAADLYAIGKLVTAFLDRHKIDYRMTSGTFLGAIRHKGIIPWDDDIDLMLAPEAKPTMQVLIDNNTFENETGLKIRWHRRTGGWEAYFSDGKAGPPILEGTLCPFIDLFCTTKSEDGRIHFELPLMYHMAPNEFYTQEEWSAKVEYEFGPYKIWGPDEPKNYFDRAFGEDAMGIAYQTVHHVDFKMKKLPQRVVVQSGHSIEYDKEWYEQRIKGR